MLDSRYWFARFWILDTCMEKQFKIWRWTWTTFWGWLLGVVMILMLSGILDSMGIEDMQFYLGLGMGMGVGFSQWILLRKWCGMKVSWILTSALGLGIPFVIFDLLLKSKVWYKLPLCVGFGALTIGLLQFSIFKSYSTQAHRWIWGCVIGWPLAVATVFTIDYTKHLEAFISSNLILALINLLLILAGGVVLGVITAVFLRKALRRNP